MIRRRSYSEAVEAGAALFDGAGVVIEERHLPRPRPLHFDMKRASYISSSSEEEDGHEEEEDGVADVRRRNPRVSAEGKGRPKSFVRSDSIRYYDMRGSQDFDDPASRLSMQQIYDSCLEYVSEENMRAERAASRLNHDHDEEADIRLGPNESVELKIVEQGDEERMRIEGDDDVIVMEEEDQESTKSDTVSVFPVTYTGRNSARSRSRRKPEYFGSRAKRHKRVVFKGGQTNIPLRNNIKGKARLFLDDFATTLIELRWRWLTFYFAACNFAVWLSFAALFYVAAYANGDFEEREEGSSHVTCLVECNSFTGMFLFSVESQVSIGYGQKSPNEECPEVIFILLMEVVVGYILIGGMTCVVYAKIIRPEKHLEGVGFAKNAVICLRDGRLCLVFRAWDTLQKHAVGFQARAWFVKHTADSVPHIYPLDLGNAPFLIWPTTIQHTIDDKSPLFDMSAKDLVDKKFEIILALAGADRSTGQMTQSKTSYLPHEILWGSRFKCTTSYNYEEHAYIIDPKCLNLVESVDTPLCSARLLCHVNEALKRGPLSVSLPASPFFLSPCGSPLLSSPSWSFRSANVNNDSNHRDDERPLNVSLP